MESLGTVGDVVTNASQGVAAADGGLKKAYKALKGIVEIATGSGVKELQAGSTTLQATGGVDNKEGVKILATDGTGGNPAATDAGKAAAILATVSGEKILASIVKSGGDDAVLSGNASGDTTSGVICKRRSNNSFGAY
ncbi:Variable major outer membrane lipoprotein [Borrelia duttonii CR2A]|uniref:Variable large protein n=1 Tax=Borrelia duttonii CR2A TaxID=1432657 RepID=W6TVW2_9SPIR|nr:Variable major outer membrane lipoprotein [Borrelia duttonii CR2A]